MTTPAELRDVERTDSTYEWSAAPASDARAPGLWIYLLAGTLFGIVLTKGEAISWFRIQEMFRFQSFHMYGIIGSAIAVAALSLASLSALAGPWLYGYLRPKPPH